MNIKLPNIKELFKRRYTLMDIGLEIVSHSESKGSIKKKTMYLVFNTKPERDLVYDKLLSLVAKDCVTTERSLEDYTQQWLNS